VYSGGQPGVRRQVAVAKEKKVDVNHDGTLTFEELSERLRAGELLEAVAHARRGAQFRGGIPPGYGTFSSAEP